MALLKKTTAQQMLDMSKTSLEKLVAADPTFPRPIKMGTAKQSAVYFDSEEIAAWIEAQKAKRAEVAA